MSAIAWLVCVIALGLIVGGILLLKQSATKFHLSEKQWEEVNKKSDAIKKEDE